jgi:hypothetical protein
MGPTQSLQWTEGAARCALRLLAAMVVVTVAAVPHRLMPAPEGPAARGSGAVTPTKVKKPPSAPKPTSGEAPASGGPGTGGAGTDPAAAPPVTPEAEPVTAVPDGGAPVAGSVGEPATESSLVDSLAGLFLPDREATSASRNGWKAETPNPWPEQWNDVPAVPGLSIQAKSTPSRAEPASLSAAARIELRWLNAGETPIIFSFRLSGLGSTERSTSAWREVRLEPGAVWPRGKTGWAVIASSLPGQASARGQGPRVHYRIPEVKPTGESK